MGETAEYQRLQETSEPDYPSLPCDDEEVDLCSSLKYTVVVICHTTSDKCGNFRQISSKQKYPHSGIMKPVKEKGVRGYLVSKIGIFLTV